MARVKICPVCDYHNDETVHFCRNGAENGRQCGVALGGISPVGSNDLKDGDMDLETKVTPPNTPIQFVLDCPWGAVAIKDELKIGRDRNYSSVAEDLQSYDKVSRIHAEMKQEDNLLYLRDMGSTNSTYVNGCAVTGQEWLQLSDGDVVGFSTELSVSVKIH